MNFYICSLPLLFLRQIFAISSSNGIPARLQMLFELAIILVIVLVCQSLSARLICEGMNLIDRRSLMREATFRGVDMFGTRAMIFELALLAVKYFIVWQLHCSFCSRDVNCLLKHFWTLLILFNQLEFSSRRSNGNHPTKTNQRPN